MDGRSQLVAAAPYWKLYIIEEGRCDASKENRRSTELNSRRTGKILTFLDGWKYFETGALFFEVFDKNTTIFTEILPYYTQDDELKVL